VLLPHRRQKLARGAKSKEHAMSSPAIAVVGIGKNSFHIAGHDERGAIVLRQKWSRGQVEAICQPAAVSEAKACAGPGPPVLSHQKA
jgi:transposase